MLDAIRGAVSATWPNPPVQVDACQYAEALLGIFHLAGAWE